MPLPPLNAVRAFEATSRLGSLAAAAAELGVTHGAISKQILHLEDHIGSRLFDRLPGGVELTESGKGLRNALIPAFRLLNSAFERYSRRAPGDQIVRVATVASFASQFLAARLADWYQHAPDICIELLTTDRVIDLGREEADIAIRYGGGQWPGVDATLLCRGQLTAVGSQQLVSEIDTELRQGTSIRVPRIQTSANDEWRIWAEGQNIELAGKSHFMEHFVVATESASNGIGIALLPDLLVRDQILSGRLKEVKSLTLDWHQSFYQVSLPGRSHRKATQQFLTWLASEVASSDAGFE